MSSGMHEMTSIGLIVIIHFASGRAVVGIFCFNQFDEIVMTRVKMVMRIRKTIMACLLVAPSFSVLSAEPHKVIIAATDRFHGGFFNRTVIMLQKHGAHGETIGLILNKPSHKLLSDLVKIPDTHPLSQEPVYVGGPIDHGRLTALVKSQQAPRNGLQLSPSLYLTMSLGSLADDWAKLGVEQVKIFQGYSGWARGQLKTEFDREAWLRGEVDQELLFSEDTEGMWKTLFDQFKGLYVYWMNDDSFRSTLVEGS